MKRYILPNHVSKTRATIITPKAIFGYIVFLFCFIFLSGGVVEYGSAVLGYATNIKLEELFQDTNELRVKNNLSPLSINEKLSKAAEAKANDMFEDDYWAHTAPDGTEPSNFIKAYGYEYSYAGENLAVDFANSKDVVDAWYKSPSHRENLINQDYTEIGFAVVNGELNRRKTTLVVQMFGKPLKGVPSILASTETSAKNTALAVDETPQTVLPTINTAESNDQAIPTSIINNAQDTIISSGSVLNSTDIYNVSRNIAIILGFFVTLVFAIDGYYVRRYQIFRMTGHTILHVLMLLMAIAGIWYTHIGLVL